MNHIIEVSINQRQIIIPADITHEELQFLHLVKQKMLQKLDDRQKFLFVYIYELGNTQKDASIVLDVHEITVARALERIREILDPFRQNS